MKSREQLRATMIENEAEINRLHRRIHETVKRRSESEEARDEWSQACEEFHARYEELCIPGGFHQDFYVRISNGDLAAIEAALCFLEVRPYFFRSGYHWDTILRKCKRAPMSKEQSERFARLLQKYVEWRRLRNLSLKRGAVVRRDLVSLLLRFHSLFPVSFSDHQFDGLVTVGDLYNVLCSALKVIPSERPEREAGAVRESCQARLQADMGLWAREYQAWRETPWTPGDVWATLVATVVEAYKLDLSCVIGPDTVLRQANPVAGS